MSSQDTPSKVVDFTQRSGQQGSEKLPGTLGLARAHGVKRLTALITTLFENADDALFDLASKADTNAVQATYFDGMREVRKKRQSTETRIQERLGRQFADFAAGRMALAKSEAAASTRASGELTLSLVDDQELEESLAVGSMVAKAENRLQRPLFALNQCLANIANQHVENAGNPIGPASIAQMFRETVSDLAVELPVRLIIYKLFDRFVLGALETVYDEINGLFLQAGVMPQLHGHVARRPGASAVLRATGPGGFPGAMVEPADATAVGGDYGSVAAELQANLYGTLCALLSSRRGEAIDPSAYAASNAAGGGLGRSHPTDLLSALTILQSQVFSAQTHALSAADAVQVGQQVKEALRSQVDKLRGEPRTKVTSADEDTIDLVGMLFEYILQDRNLPVPMQALIGRLQIPFLKVALLDKHLFARRTHPARQLLDAMAEASVGWSEESDRDHRLRDKVKEIVDTLLKDFEDDLDIFDRLRIDFDAFVEANKRRAERVEQRAAEATRGREKLFAARRTAAREIMQRIEHCELPELIRNLLSRPWANYLVLVLLRGGESSDEWLQGLHFADELVWSVHPKHDPAERDRLRDILPLLEKRLRHGLATVAFDENDVRGLMHQLHALYAPLLGRALPESAAAPRAPGIVADVASVAQGPMVALQQGEGDSVLAALEDETSVSVGAIEERFVAQVRALNVGKWLEFVDAQGNTERAKLSWISPASSKYLFVNRKGLKIADKNVQQLALELATGRAAVLEEVPLFDRALDAIIERLKSAHAAAKPAAPSSS